MSVGGIELFIVIVVAIVVAGLGPRYNQSRADARRPVFIDFFYLPAHGVPVTVTEWQSFLRGLAKGLVPTGLDQFYALGRSVLVKREAYFDPYDQAFVALPGRRVAGGHRRGGLGMAWNRRMIPGPQRRTAPAVGRRARRPRRRRSRRSSWSAQGAGPSPTTAATSGWAPAGPPPSATRASTRPASASAAGAAIGAVKVAGERRFRGYRTDQEVGVRQSSSPCGGSAS